MYMYMMLHAPYVIMHNKGRGWSFSPHNALHLTCINISIGTNNGLFPCMALYKYPSKVSTEYSEMEASAMFLPIMMLKRLTIIRANAGW